jgi:uncharacterized protein
MAPIDKDLLAILVCPESHQALSEAAPELVTRLNQRAQAGALKNQAGAAVTQALEAGLVRQDGKIVYPIRDGIPVLLVDEGLVV